jgi:pyroglutamyl-peptidase
MRTLLVTGFGPFPGAPYNPTAVLVQRLARLRRPNLHLIGHIFPTEYTAVDRDLPKLIEKHRPDALLMFGLHGRARTLRVETLARNVIGQHRDAGGTYASACAIVPGASHMRMVTPAARLAQAARRAHVPAVTSRNAGSYLCNYLCWQATDITRPRLAAFVHIPPVVRKPLRKGKRGLRASILERAATAMLIELSHCLGSARKRT